MDKGKIVFENGSEYAQKIDLRKAVARLNETLEVVGMQHSGKCPKCKFPDKVDLIPVAVADKLYEALDQMVDDLSNSEGNLPVTKEGFGIGVCLDAWNQSKEALTEYEKFKGGKDE